jgi:hypothetical protein
MSMLPDVHSLQLLMLCQLSKSAPNILWTARGLLSDNPLQVAGGHPTMEIAKISLQSWFERKLSHAVLLMASHK